MPRKKTPDFEELLSKAISGYSELSNRLNSVSQKLDLHITSTDEKLEKIITAVDYTNGKVRKLDLWKAELQGIEKGKAMATGRMPRMSWNKILIGILTLLTAIAVAIDHWIISK